MSRQFAGMKLLSKRMVVSTATVTMSPGRTTSRPPLFARIFSAMVIPIAHSLPAAPERSPDRQEGRFRRETLVSLCSFSGAKRYTGASAAGVALLQLVEHFHAHEVVQLFERDGEIG